MSASSMVMGIRATDPALFEAARRGDGAAREAVVDVVLPEVLQWCARLGGPKVDPEDACHDVCLVLLGRFDRVPDVDRLAPWLFSVTRRVLAQHRRRAWVRRWVPGLVPDVPDPRADPRRAAEDEQLVKRIQAALESLSPDHREVLVLHELEERTEAEIAELLDLPIGTVRSRTRAAREHFRRVARRYDLVPPVVEIAGEGRR